MSIMSAIRVVSPCSPKLLKHCVPSSMVGTLLYSGRYLYFIFGLFRFTVAARKWEMFSQNPSVWNRRAISSSTI
jgi:hypothetical protein